MNNYQGALLNGIHFYLKKFYNYPKKGMIFKIHTFCGFIPIVCCNWKRLSTLETNLQSNWSGLWEIGVISGYCIVEDMDTGRLSHETEE